jgi:hypothetical protein
MDLQTRKIEFVQTFLKLQSEELVSLLENILSAETKKDLKSMSVEELNQRIDQSEKDIESGNYKSHEEVFAKYN